MTNLTGLIDQIGQLNTEANQQYKMYKEKKELIDGLKMQLADTMHELGLKSAKTDEFNASVSQKGDIVIVDEHAVMDWLKETPEIESDAYIGLKTTMFKSLARTWLKDTGEVIPGTETTSTESITIRKAK